VDAASKSQEYFFISISTGHVLGHSGNSSNNQRLIIIWNLTHPPFYSSAKAYRQQIALSSSWLDPSYESYQEVSHAFAAFTNENIHPVMGCHNSGYKVHADTHKRG
jgi:hypothetical protein